MDGQKEKLVKEEVIKISSDEDDEADECLNVGMMESESTSLEDLPETRVHPGAAMAPLPPMTCSAAGCDYSTPEGAPDFAAQLTCMSLHTQQAHPAQGAAGAALVDRPICKVDKQARPTVSLEMSEHDWRFFLSEWDDYKRATGISGQNMLDELWSCMVPDLKKLAFDQGGKDLLNTEDLMLARLKLLAVSVLHAAVHTVSLHEARQMPEESTKAFAARVRGIAANCHLSKDCPAPCGRKVSFLEETVYHVVLAGLRDREMQERCLSAAILKTITDINSLVEFCSAEESGRISTPSTVGGLRASASGVSLENSNLVFPSTRIGETSVTKVKIKNRSSRDQSVIFQPLSPSTPFRPLQTNIDVKSNFYVTVPIQFDPRMPGEVVEELRMSWAEGIITASLRGFAM